MTAPPGVPVVLVQLLCIALLTARITRLEAAVAEAAATNRRLKESQ